MAREFRENLLGIVTLIIVVLGILSLMKLNSDSTTHANSAVVQPDLDGSDHHLYAAVYSTKGGLSSTLGLNNTLNHDLSARVTLFNKHGETLSTPEMNITLGPHKNHGFNIADWVRGHGDFDEGSLEVFYHGKSMTLGAQEIVSDAGHGLSFDVHLSEYDDFMSSRVEGLWWSLDNQSEADVFMANTEESPTNVTPYFYVAGTEYQGETIALGGHETGSIDIEQALTKLHVPGDTIVGGISLSYTNGPGAIAAVGVVQNKHTGFSTTMRFIDRSGQKTTTLHGASLPIGKAEPSSGYSSSARFTPHVIVRNNTTQAVQVSPMIRYTLFDQPHAVTLSPLTLSSNQVRELDLTSVISAIGNNVISDSGIEIGHIGAPGAVMAYAVGVDQSGGRVFDVPIKDPKNMPFQGGSYPWNIEGNNHAVLHVKSIDAPNDGQKRQFMVKLYYDGGEYNVPLQQVEAGQTGELDIKKLRDDQVKDVLGNVIPLNVTGGQLAWYGRANKGEFIGRLAEYDPVAGTSSSFSCVQNCLCNTGFFSGFMTPGTISGFSGDSFPLDALETDADCNQANQFTYEIYGPQFLSSNSNVVTISGATATLVDQGGADISVDWDAFTVDQQCTALASDGECVDARCPTNSVSEPISQTQVVSVKWTTPHTLNNQDGAVPLASGTPPENSPAFINSTTISVVGSPSGGTYSWSTSSNKVTLTNTSSATVTVTAAVESAATRDVTITVTYTYGGHSSSAQIPFTVQKPTFMSFSSNAGSGTATCPSGQSGVYKNITWQVQDKNHNPIPYALPTYDTLTNNTPNTCFVPATGDGTPPGQPTDATGKWGHHYAVCSTACNNGGSCSLTGTQKYFSNGAEIDQSYTMSCSTITVDGH